METVIQWVYLILAFGQAFGMLVMLGVMLVLVVAGVLAAIYGGMEWARERISTWRDGRRERKIP